MQQNTFKETFIFHGIKITAMAEVSIVFVNYNGKGLLKKSLDSANKAISKEKKKYEIIVVDNDSSDRSVEFIKKHYKSVKIVQNKSNLGYCGINSALPHCKGKYILFLNNDIVIGRNCLKELMAAISKGGNIAMAAPKLVNYYNKKLESGGTWVSRAFYNGHVSGRHNLNEIPYLGVGLIRKDVVSKFGYLFDKDYFIYAEDLDLGLRLRLAGYRVVFAPKAVIFHFHAATTKNFAKGRATFLLERNLLTTFFKILSLKNIILFSPYVFLMRFLAIIKDIITLRFSNALSRVMAIFWVLLNLGRIARKRKELQRLRKADDNFILEVFSERYLFKKPVIV